MSESPSDETPAEPGRRRDLAPELPDFSSTAPHPSTHSPVPRLARRRSTPVLDTDSSWHYVRMSKREHRMNALALTLTFLAPAALFGTLWWPLTGDAGTHFGVARPTPAILTGLACALACVIIGLGLHFIPRSRPEILDAVDDAAILPSPQSVEVSETWRSRTRTPSAIYTGLAVVLGLGAAVAGIAAILALGNAGAVFGLAALLFACIAVGIGAAYVPVTARRSMKQLRGELY